MQIRPELSQAEALQREIFTGLSCSRRSDALEYGKYECPVVHCRISHEVPVKRRATAKRNETTRLEDVMVIQLAYRFRPQGVV